MLRRKNDSCVSTSPAGHARDTSDKGDSRSTLSRVPVPVPSPIETTIVYDTYWRLACERQSMFYRRAAGAPAPWTTDPILTKYKFTNAYRASDRVSQYLIRRVIYEGDPSTGEVFFRTLLFKFFNKIETWELLRKALGEISYSGYSFQAYDKVLTRAMEKDTRIFSAAYIMPYPTAASVRKRKHQVYLSLLERMMEEDLPARLTDTPSMRHAFDLLKSYPMIGDFLAYQYVVDLNYSTVINFSEMDLVVPGPGCRDGIRKCFSNLGGLSEADIVRLACERQEAECARLGIHFASLWGRPLQLIDCQNLFCEVDKYARIAHPEIKGISGRTRIKQLYSPNPEAITYWYPPKWGINDCIGRWRDENAHSQELF
jgi:hypothetical protein